MRSGLKPYIGVQGLTLIPLVQGDKMPAEKGWQKKDYDSAAVAKAADALGSVGVRLSDQWCVVDVDPRNYKDKVDSLNKLMEERGLFLQFQEAPCVNTGSGGFHFYFRKPVDIRLANELQDYPGIEMKSTQGRQVVAPGSLHPATKRPYEWNKSRSRKSLAEAPELPIPLLELYRSRFTADNSEADGPYLEPSKAVAFFKMLGPASEFMKKQDSFKKPIDWFRVIAAAHSLFRGSDEALDAFLAWSAEDPLYGDSARASNKKRWDSCHFKPQFSAGKPVDGKYLLHFTNGQVPQDAPETEFEAVPEEPKAPSKPAKPSYSLEDLERINQRFFVCSGQYYRECAPDGWDKYEPILKDYNVGMLDADFPTKFSVKGRGYMTLAALWREWPGRRVYEGIVTDPQGSVPSNYYNLWRGWAVKPTKGSWTKFRQALLEALCEGKEEYLSYMLDWCALYVQQPGKLPGVALVLKGHKGTGKGTLGAALAKFAPKNSIQINSAKNLVGDFQGHLAGKTFVFADEAVWGGDKKAEGALKGLVTEGSQTFNIKHKEARPIQNYTHLLMASNEEWVVPASEDERRWAVFQTHKLEHHTAEFWDAVHTELYKQGGHEAFLYDLLQRDLTKFDVRAVPRTQALQGQMDMSAKGIKEWWLDVLIEGKPLDVMNGDWLTEPVYVNRRLFFAAYKAHNPRDLNAQTCMKFLQGFISAQRSWPFDANKRVDHAPSDKDQDFALMHEVELPKPPPSAPYIKDYWKIPSLAECRKLFDPMRKWE